MSSAANERAEALNVVPSSSLADRQHVIGLGVLFGAMYFIQSVGDPTSGLVAQPARSLLKQWGDDATSMADFMALLALPWALKPLLGLFADFVPMFGSRRRFPLLVSSALSGVGLFVLAYFPPDSHLLLFALLILPTLGIALGDVLIDALMIEEGQPRGLTGTFQSIQWAAANAALLIAAVLGGYFAGAQSQSHAFLLCALLWVASFVMTLRYVQEPRVAVRPGWRDHVRELKSALGAPGLVPACAILFLWSFNPVWQSVLYLHVTNALGMSEQTFGNAISIFFGGCMVASLLYGTYCRRISLGYLVHGSIIAGIASNALYLVADTETAFFAVSALAGFTYMTGTLIQLDVAARLIPLAVAATLFATIMALTNISSSLSEMLGGRLYDSWRASAGELGAYQLVVAMSALFAASCWALMPWLKRELPSWWSVTRQTPLRNT